MAAAEALALPEILEQILLAMDDTKTLLFAGRVNNHWRAVISDSVKLQEALFFRQSAPPTDGRFVERNPLLLEYGDEGCNLCDLYHSHTWECDSRTCKLGAQEPASALRMYLTSAPRGRLRLCTPTTTSATRADA